MGAAKAERRGVSDRFVDVGIAVGDVFVDRVEAVGQHTDAADYGATLI
jgi:hypothetical protein